jgi:hypothetical protein
MLVDSCSLAFQLSIECGCACDSWLILLAVLFCLLSLPNDLLGSPTRLSASTTPFTTLAGCRSN